MSAFFIDARENAFCFWAKQGRIERQWRVSPWLLSCLAEIFPNKAKIIAFKALSPNYRPEVLQRKAFRKKTRKAFGIGFYEPGIYF